jgi:deoxyadenosine/deoxycytidine kinase
MRRFAHHPPSREEAALKIVIIYGPPGVGKLTVAAKLAERTDFKLLHCHQVADLIASVMPFGTIGFLPLMEKIRMDVLKTACKDKKIMGVILTGVYEPEEKIELSERFLRRIDRLSGGRVLLVRLKCAEWMLYRRIKGLSRSMFRKVRQKDRLRQLLEDYRLFEAVKFKKSLTIDNTKLSAANCAERIRKHYHL